MRTTEAAPTTEAKASGASNLELYLIAALALAYVLAWWSFGARVPGPPLSARRSLPGSPAGPTPGRTVLWLQEIPVAERPSFVLPDGWRLADRRATPPRQIRRPASDPVPAPVPVDRARRGRVRTRSS